MWQTVQLFRRTFSSSLATDIRFCHLPYASQFWLISSQNIQSQLAFNTSSPHGDLQCSRWSCSISMGPGWEEGDEEEESYSQLVHTKDRSGNQILRAHCGHLLLQQNLPSWFQNMPRLLPSAHLGTCQNCTFYLHLYCIKTSGEEPSHLQLYMLRRSF